MKKMTFLFLIAFSFEAFAYNNIITGGTNSSVLVYKGAYSSKYTSSFNGAIGFSHVHYNGLEVVTNLGATLYSGGSSWLIEAGAGYNFNVNDIQNSFFVHFLPSVTFENYSSSTHTQSYPEISLKGGKRFNLKENITWNPSVSIYTSLKKNYNHNPNFLFNLFNISIFL